MALASEASASGAVASKGAAASSTFRVRSMAKSDVEASTAEAYESVASVGASEASEVFAFRRGAAA